MIDFSVKEVNINISNNMFLWVMIIDQLYRKMRKEASVKNDLMKKIINTDFLQENLLKQEFELHNEHVFYENKIPSEIKVDIHAQKIECQIFTKCENNVMNLKIEDYYLDLKQSNEFINSSHLFSSLCLYSDQTKQKF